MSDTPLGFYVVYQQHFEDHAPREVRIGPFADEAEARRGFENFIARGDRNKREFRLIHRHETTLEEHE